MITDRRVLLLLVAVALGGYAWGYASGAGITWLTNLIKLVSVGIILAGVVVRRVRR